jgi:uncharacterized YccA/Bax inhibitor family protein
MGALRFLDIVLIALYVVWHASRIVAAFDFAVAVCKACVLACVSACIGEEEGGGGIAAITAVLWTGVALLEFSVRFDSNSRDARVGAPPCEFKK